METEENNVIPAEDFRKAIETCCRLPRLNRYYSNAPQSARLFIALQFYARVFASSMSDAKYQTCLDEIEPDLGLEDVDYLLEGETDLGAVPYLENLRSRLVADAAPSTAKLTGRGVPGPQARREEPAESPPMPEKPRPSVPAAEVSSMLTPTRRIKPAGRLKRVADVRREQEQMDGVADLPIGQPGQSEYEQQLRAARMERVKERLLMVVAGALVVAVGFAGWHFFGDDILALVRPTVSPDREEPSVRRDEPLLPADGQDAIARAEAAAKERIAQAEGEAKERIALEAAAQKERLELEQKRREEVAEQKRRDEEARLRAEQERSKRKRYDDAVLAFKSASYGFWRDAPKEDRPGSVKTESLFLCLLPSEKASYDLFELKVSPGGRMEVARLSPDRDAEAVPADEFTKRAASSPHLLLHGEQAYFSGAARTESNAALRVPAPGNAFNPFREEFGPLYEIARGLGVANPPLAYEVGFLPKGEDAEVHVETVFFGRDVPYTTFRNKVSEWMARQTAQRRSKTASKRRKRTVVLSDTQMVRRRMDGVTEVPRTFVYSSSNKHRYWSSSRQYENEVRKEEIARAKWQQLYDEAVRQEVAEEESLRKLDISACAPSDSDLEGVLRFGSVVYREKR